MVSVHHLSVTIHLLGRTKPLLGVLENVYGVMSVREEATLQIEYCIRLDKCFL